jgi:hypothetical protein
VSIFTRIRDMIVPPVAGSNVVPHNQAESPDDHAKTLLPWSEDLLGYMLYTVMHDVRRQGRTSQTDLPILWRTGQWRQSAHLGQPAIFAKFDVTNARSQAVIVTSGIFHYDQLLHYPDDFFSVLKVQCDLFSVGRMLVARAILHFHFEAIDNHLAWKGTRNGDSLVQRIFDFDFGGATLGCLFDSTSKLDNFIKNHLTKRKGAVKDMSCFDLGCFDGRSYSVVKRQNLLRETASYIAGYDRSKILAYRDLSQEDLRAMVGYVPIKYRFWESCESTSGRELETSARISLRKAVDCAAKYNIVTDQLARKLLSFRIEWQQARLAIANVPGDDSVAATRATRAMNQLLEREGFSNESTVNTNKARRQGNR